jgi:hypothetical protein
MSEIKNSKEDKTGEDKADEGSTVLILGESDNCSFTKAYSSLNKDHKITCTFYEKKNLNLKELKNVIYVYDVDATKVDMSKFDIIIFCFPFNKETNILIEKVIQQYIKTSTSLSKLSIGLAVTKPNKLLDDHNSTTFYSKYTEMLILELLSKYDIQLESVSSFKPYIKDGYQHTNNHNKIESKTIWDANVKVMFTFVNHEKEELKDKLKYASDIMGNIFPGFYPRPNLNDSGKISLFNRSRAELLQKIKEDFDF